MKKGGEEIGAAIACVAVENAENGDMRGDCRLICGVVNAMAILEIVASS